jgi:hypothetical protein
MRIWATLLLVAACSNSGTPNVGVNTGGGADGGSGGPDAPGGVLPHDSPGGGMVFDDAGYLHGRVCLAADPRKLVTAVDPAACATTGANGLLVSLTGSPATTTTMADGTFTIAAPNKVSGALWTVGGANIVTSYMVIGDYEIPALSTATYTSMRSANGVATGYGEAAIMMTVIRNGAGFAGATATSSPPGDYGAFYDGTSATTWTQTMTGGFGTVWLPNMDVGNVTATVAVVGSSAGGTTPGEPLFDGGITFVSVVFP